MFQTHLPSSWWEITKLTLRAIDRGMDYVAPFVFFYLAIAWVAPDLPTKTAIAFAVWSVLGVNASISLRIKNDPK